MKNFIVKTAKKQLFRVSASGYQNACDRVGLSGLVDDCDAVSSSWLESMTATAAPQHKAQIDRGEVITVTTKPWGL